MLQPKMTSDDGSNAVTGETRDAVTGAERVRAWRRRLRTWLGIVRSMNELERRNVS
jgi:hypothetical protein